MKTKLLILAVLSVLFIAGCNNKPLMEVTTQITYVNGIKDTINIITSSPEDLSITFTNFAYTLSDGLQNYAVNVKAYRVLEVKYLGTENKVTVIDSTKIFNVYDSYYNKGI